MSKQNNEIFDEITAVKEKEVKTDNAKLIIVISVIVIVFIGGLGVGLWFLSQQVPQNERLEELPLRILEEETEPQTFEDFYLQIPIPVNTPDWTRIPHFYGFWENEELRNQAIQWAYHTELGNITRFMPSMEQGFTSDPAYARNEDGTPNLRFSYMLKEDVEYSFAVNVQRLLNPVFGDWYGLQNIPVGFEIQYASFGRMQNMFTEQWWEENMIGQTSFEHFPIFADWNRDDFGGLEFREIIGTRFVERMNDGFGFVCETVDECPDFEENNIGGDFVEVRNMGRFFGEIIDGDFEVETVDTLEIGVSRFTVRATLDIHFAAFDNESGRHTERGTLVIELVENPDDFENREYRFLINYATLVMR